MPKFGAQVALQQLWRIDDDLDENQLRRQIAVAPECVGSPPTPLLRCPRPLLVKSTHAVGSEYDGNLARVHILLTAVSLVDEELLFRVLDLLAGSLHCHLSRACLRRLRVTRHGHVATCNFSSAGGVQEGLQVACERVCRGLDARLCRRIGALHAGLATSFAAHILCHIEQLDLRPVEEVEVLGESLRDETLSSLWKPDDDEHVPHAEKPGQSGGGRRHSSGQRVL
mmetsp:Transcript_30805/g.94436  ORF Transcript_30805/g.94436 Transcript_30805/m.94436 type:complete len:226 (-) Transcript_30805:186-863(-)